jgi:hypothetical protein
MSPEATSMGLESIPGIGPSMAADLRSIGIFKVSDLKVRDPEQLYRALEDRAGRHVDRCVLYVFRCAVYYASNDRHDPEKLKWWNWKDRR